MKIQALKRFRKKLANSEPVYGLWVTLESASITEMAVSLGMDWVVVDAEHGHLGWKEINDHVRAAVRSETVVLVRLQERSTALTKRVLDIGADGVVIPWISKIEELEEAILDARYPLDGRRGIGGERATVWGQCVAQVTAEANEHVLVVPIIESVAAVPHVQSMCEVDGADIFFFGPNDFSATAGYRGQWEGPGVAEQILQLKDIISAAGKHCGLMTTGTDNLVQRRDQGFSMLGIGADNGLLLRSIHQALQAVEHDRMPAPSLDPSDGHKVHEPLKEPPEDKIPDRYEVITRLGEGKSLAVEKGFTSESLVGDFNTARNLTTGILTMHPEALLDYHMHPSSESLTVLEGEAECSVEGRTYRLGPLDNITIPRWVPHKIRNLDSRNTVKMHVAMAMSIPEQQSVVNSFDIVEMSLESTGCSGFERVTRFSNANRQLGVGPGAEFVDYFNASLMPGIEMSGGFARFAPGGRLPDHLHDFDESICIVHGLANCLVEGRKYSLNRCATAMVPRGRVHYFINESEDIMDMIWVYAGPMPERILIASGYVRD
jgi:2-keto-3-deoxy-L-rhamnonate aldolase RhmA/quercetin dioxygenase-like cupin family protein